MPKPICVGCQRFFRPKKNGFYYVEGMPVGFDVAPGTKEPERWKPYKLWVGDLWVCHGCNTEIVVGSPSSPISENHKQDFADNVKSFKATLQVNDC